jgi:ribosome-associated toxin RatA of RatAB toxin-antitoxin module
MRHVEIVARARGLSASEIYALLADFPRYPEFCRAVRSVKVMTAEDGRAISAWEVSFRSGVLRWTEENEFSADQHTVRFRQIEGDVEYFAGEWSVSQHSQECVVRFVCDFDMGIPGLNDILEPIAELALRDHARSILTGLIPSIEVVSTSDGSKVGGP